MSVISCVIKIETILCSGSTSKQLRRHHFLLTTEKSEHTEKSITFLGSTMKGGTMTHPSTQA